MNPPCVAQIRGSDPIGAPCPDCGHTNLVHPGHANPALTECVLCVLVNRAEGA
jgi:hypothetical protein